MEVCHHRITDFEFVARFNKEARIGAFCPDLSFRILRGARFNRSQARRAHADNAASFGFGLVDLFGCFRRDAVPLGVHNMLRQIFNTHGLECTGADVQRHENFFASFVANLLKKFIGEMKSCRRSSNCSGIFGINRLVTAFIRFFSGMLNVGRQRNFAVFVQHFQHRTIKFEAEEFAFASEDFSSCRLFPFRMIKVQDRSRFCRFAGTHHRNGFISSGDAFGHRFEDPAGFFLTVQTGLDDLCVVKDKKIAGLQQIQNISEMQVFYGAVRFDVQKTRSCAIFQRILRDQRFGQFKIKI